ncbi:MAG: hypothetical protein KBS55_02830 [Bacteroidales bacterium]|nr:hypothetical protein [Candidatus Cryptobacteroides aphodequi]
MFFVVIYLLGAVAGIFCAVDIARRKGLSVFKRIWLSALTILLSWIMVIYYFYVLRTYYNRRGI